jgi:PTS system mannose-specific IIC component
MIFSQICLASMVSVVAGLDRTAAFQLMISRPIVAAPLTGWLLGEPLMGLEVGLLVELLWLCCLPVGAAVPPDDTQVSIAATLVAVAGQQHIEAGSLSLVLVAVFFCCAMGKIGQVFDGWARRYNGRFINATQKAVAEGDMHHVGSNHLQGLIVFALASWASFLVIGVGAALFLYLFFVVFSMGQPLAPVTGFLRILFPLVGAVAILSNLKVRRSVTLYFASFVSTLMLFWIF